MEQNTDYRITAVQKRPSDYCEFSDKCLATRFITDLHSSRKILHTFPCENKTLGGVHGLQVMHSQYACIEHTCIQDTWPIFMAKKYYKL